MDYNKLKSEVSEFLGTIIDREDLILSDDIEYDIGLESDFDNIVSVIEDFLGVLEQRQEKREAQADNIMHELAVEERHSLENPIELERQENFCN
jgi:hypothetical protein